MWAAFAVSILSFIHTESWSNKVYAVYNSCQFLYGDMQWYICCFTFIFLLLCAIESVTDFIITKVMMFLVLGKIADMFSCPFMYGASEFMLDIIIGCLALLLWLKRNRIKEKILNFVTTGIKLKK